MRFFAASTMFLLVTAMGLLARAQERVPEIRFDDFDRIRTHILPPAGESRWREIAWLTNITEARRRSLDEDKPILIFTAADGSPLART